MPVPFPPTITITALHDPVIDQLGFDPHDAYLPLTGTEVTFVRGVFGSGGDMGWLLTDPF